MFIYKHIFVYMYQEKKKNEKYKKQLKEVKASKIYVYANWLHIFKNNKCIHI